MANPMALMSQDEHLWPGFITEIQHSFGSFFILWGSHEMTRVCQFAVRGRCSLAEKWLEVTASKTKGLELAEKSICLVWVREDRSGRGSC